MLLCEHGLEYMLHQEKQQHEMAKENISIMMIAQDSNEINITVAVETPEFEKAVKAIYDEFVTKEDLQ